MARTCSRWDWQRMCFDYFVVDHEDASPGGWKPLTGLGHETAVAPSSALGISIEDALPLLPEGARLVGSGVRARGQIVRPVRPDDELGDTPAPEARGESAVASGFLIGVGLTALLPLPAALPIFLTGAGLGYAMATANRRRSQEALSGVRRVRRVFKVSAP